MKKILITMLCITSFDSFAFSVVDSMYENKNIVSTSRDPSSDETKHCLVNENNEVFGKSCYSSLDLCNKRLEFWKDLPGAKAHTCIKVKK